MSGAKVLASALTSDGLLLYGTRESLGVLSGTEHEHVWPWAVVTGASWSAPEATLLLRIAAEAPDQPVSGDVVEHRFVLGGAEPLLDLVRERVQASVLVTRSCRLVSGGEATLALRSTASTTAMADAFRWSLDLPRGAGMSLVDRQHLMLTSTQLAEELGLEGVAPPLVLRGP